MHPGPPVGSPVEEPLVPGSPLDGSPVLGGGPLDPSWVVVPSVASVLVRSGPVCADPDEPELALATSVVAPGSVAGLCSWAHAPPMKIAPKVPTPAARRPILGPVWPRRGARVAVPSRSATRYKAPR